MATPTPFLPVTTPPAEAKAAGFWPLTIFYMLPSEQWMMENVIADLTRAGTGHLLVGHPQAPEVWRKGHRIHNSKNAATIAQCSPTRPWDA